MKCSELIEYLKRFNPEEDIAIVAFDLENGIYYKMSAYQLLEKEPALFLEIGESGGMDDLESEADNG